MPVKANLNGGFFFLSRIVVESLTSHFSCHCDMLLLLCWAKKK